MSLSRSYVISSFIYVVVSIILCTIPLLNYLGYEFSAAIALLVPFIAGWTTISNLKPQTSKQLLAFHWQSLKGNLLLLLIPFLVITVNLFWVKNCSYGEGILFYILLPCVTVLFSVSLALFCGVMFRRAKLLYTLLVLLILCHPLYIGYTTPAIYSYNFIYGYFPGFSYDEVLEISPTLIVFRLVTIITAVFLLFLTLFIVQNNVPGDNLLTKIISLSRLTRRERLNSLVIGLLLILAGIWLFKEQIGFESSSELIQKSLGKKIETEHFRIWYSPVSFDDAEIRWVAGEHEFRFTQVEEALETDFTEKIDSYIYPDTETKRRFIGTGTTNIAKPWRNELHQTKDSWQATLKHELVHVLAGEFGMPIIKTHYNTGVVEGLATAIDDEWGNRTLDEYAKAILQFGIVRNPEQLISPTGFLVQTSSVSYVMMGSFCKFLIAQYGISRFKELYRGRGVRLVFGKPYEQLVEEWKEHLFAVTVPEEWRAHVLYVFKRPSIFAKECARRIAYLNERANAERSVGNNKEAEYLFAISLANSWNTEAFAGLVRLKYDTQKFDEVIAMMDEHMKDSLHRSALSSLLLLYADAMWARGDNDSAMNVYKQLKSLDLSERYNEVVELRMLSLRDTSLRHILMKFFTSSMSDTEALLLLDTLGKKNTQPLLNYLKAQVRLRQKNFRDAIQNLEKISLNNPMLLFGKERMLGEAYFRLKDFQQAKIHFWQSLNYITNKASIQRIEDWIERSNWFENNAGNYWK